jgi:4-amino-4-deoxy-L-arabinose transferase-like glycosyltransferase
MSLTFSPQQRLTGAFGKWIVIALETFCILMVVFVYLSHLGYLPLDIESDEARRALVTSEMMLSGNYVTPTLNGEIYLNKPPLYNYIVAGYFKLFGNYSMFAFRLQCIIAVLLTGLLIYHFSKKYTGHTVAFFSALAYITNGRFLMYESLYGMIDTTFSLVVYANFLLIFHFGEQKKNSALFIFSYIACALAFLMKGLPAIVFQGISLLTWFGLKRNFKALFSKEHLYGMLAFLLILTPYYLLFFSVNKVSISTVLSTLFSESEKRTFIEHDNAALFKHLISFPAEIVYHFLPWTIFLLALFRKNVIKIIKGNAFIQFITLAFLANIVVYWVSPDVYPKYLFMFVPLLYTVVFYFYFRHLSRDAWQKKVINIILISCVGALFLGSMVLPFSSVINVTELPYIKAGFLIACLAICCCMVIRYNNKYRLYFFLVALLVCRAGFNWFVVEQRGERFFKVQSWAYSINDITKGKQLCILENSDTGNFDGISFQIETLRKEVLKLSPNIKPGSYYITDSISVQKHNLVTDMQFENLPYHNKLFLAHSAPAHFSRTEHLAGKMMLLQKETTASR